MLKLLLYKWFGLSDKPCETCEVLRIQLAKSESERADLLSKLLAKDTPEPLQKQEAEEFKPIVPQYIPWRVRQQMLQEEDSKRAQLLKQSADEIDKLEKELGVARDVSSESGGVQFKEGTA